MESSKQKFPVLEIIADRRDFLIVNKPAGLLTHPDLKNPQDTLVDYLLESFPQIKKVGESPQRPGIVHRLDKGTSGIMIVAKNNKTFQDLKKQFQKKEIQKTYLALVHGALKKEQGEINLPIGRSLKNTALRTTSLYAKDRKEAQTLYKTKKIFEWNVSQKNKVFYTLLEVFPKTGRTHQIRVHLKAIGYPVVGDPVYRFKRSFLPPRLKRMFLLAKKIEFNNLEGKRENFAIEMDEELKEVLKNLTVKSEISC